MTAPDWGDVPTWVGGVATFATLVAAGIAAWYARGVYRIERDRDLEADADRARLREREDRAQAELVSVWATLDSPTAGRKVTAAQLVNSSRTPVYDVTILWAVELNEGQLSAPRIMEYLGVLPPPGWYMPLKREQVRELNGVPPEADYKLAAQMTPTVDHYRIRIEFRDAGGRLWARDYSGDLERVQRT